MDAIDPSALLTLIQENTWTAIAIFGWIVSEWLASIPAVKANSVFQLVKGLLDKLVTKKATPPVVLLLLFFVSLSGCASTKGTMFDGRVCTFATNEDVQKDIDVIIATAVPGQYQAQAQMAQQLAKLSATAVCEAARAAQAQQAQ